METKYPVQQAGLEAACREYARVNGFDYESHKALLHEKIGASLYAYEEAKITINAELLEALELGVRVRAAQRHYFKVRTQEALIASKQLEKEFDEKASIVITRAKG